VGKLACKIEMKKEGGITISIESADGKNKHNIVISEESIVTTVKGTKESTITQKNDGSITIKCVDFTLDAETITCKSSKATKHTSSDTTTIESTKDMTISTSAALTAKATGDAKLSGKGVTIEALQDAKMSGLNVKHEAKVGAEMKGVTVKVDGTGQVEVGGTLVKVASKTQLALEGTVMAELKGPITQLGGPVIKLG
jgi:hypothetical protein